MMDLVLILVVSVVARTEAKIGEREAFGNTNSIFSVGDGSTLIQIEERKDLIYSMLLLLWRDAPGRLVLEAVCFEDVVARPLVGAIVVVEIEERAGVEKVDVMLLWNALSDTLTITMPLRSLLLT